MAARLYTLVASTSRHSIDLWAYVDDVLCRLAGGATDVGTLLPDRWRESPPESMRTYWEQEKATWKAKQKQRRARRRRLAAARG